jgi:multiple sugar transport system permease protein
MTPENAPRFPGASEVTAGTPDQIGAAGRPLPEVVGAQGSWRRPRAGWLKQALFIVLLLGLSLLFIYPLVWMISASLKPSGQVFDNRLIPETWSWPYDHQDPQSNSPGVFAIAPVARWLWNSLWIGALAALAVTFSSALVAFAFAYFRFPLRNFLFALILATMMLPDMVTMIPKYLIWNELGLVNTQYPLWVPNLFASAFYTFLLRQFFLGIPRELFEASRMDGDSYFSMFRRIAIPLAKPALIVVFIFEMQAKWFDLLQPLIYLRDSALYTLPLGLKTIFDQFGLGGGGEQQWQVIMAGTVLTVLPMIVLFAVFQRYFVSGIATQGRKG